MGKQENNDDVPDGPLTERELRLVRRIIIADSRAQWFWATARIWVGWIVGAPPALYVMYQAIQHFFGIKDK